MQYNAAGGAVGALVQVHRPDAASAVLPVIRSKNPKWTFSSYAEYTAQVWPASSQRAVLQKHAVWGA
jgi:hypothetical protein